MKEELRKLGEEVFGTCAYCGADIRTNLKPRDLEEGIGVKEDDNLYTIYRDCEKCGREDVAVIVL